MKNCTYHIKKFMGVYTGYLKIKVIQVQDVVGNLTRSKKKLLKIFTFFTVT